MQRLVKGYLWKYISQYAHMQKFLDILFLLLSAVTLLLKTHISILQSKTSENIPNQRKYHISTLESIKYLLFCDY